MRWNFEDLHGRNYIGKPSRSLYLEASWMRVQLRELKDSLFHQIQYQD